MTAETGQEPYIMCRAWHANSDDLMASGQADNKPESKGRFEYYAQEYGKTVGKMMFTNCVRFSSIAPEYRSTFEPGRSYRGDRGENFRVIKATFLPDNWSSTPSSQERARKATSTKTDKATPPTSPAIAPIAAPQLPSRTKVQIDAEARAQRAAEREAEYQRKRKEHELHLAEQKRQVEEFERATAKVARKQADQRAALEAAASAYRRQQEIYAEAIRQHDAKVGQYETELAAHKIRTDFDARQKAAKASTDTDANRCVTAAETQQNAAFQGNTAASVINGCGTPVDVRICLMTARGWNCGVTWGLRSQGKWSHSSFDATGQVFVDARVSGSERPLAPPQ
jgi:hypothetical protein